MKTNKQKSERDERVEHSTLFAAIEVVATSLARALPVAVTVIALLASPPYLRVAIAKPTASKSSGANRAESAKKQENTITLNFPTSHSMGRLYKLDLTNPEGPAKIEPPINAAGKITVPATTKLLLVLSYEGVKDLPWLLSMKTDALYSIDAGHLDGFSDINLRQISELKSIKVLALDDTDITDEGMKSIGKMTQLLALSIQQIEATDRGLAELKNLTHLKRLRIDYVRLKEGNPSCISGLTDLTYLNMSYTGATDETLRSLKPLQSLKTFHVANCRKITDKGIQYLSQLKNLHVLDVQGTSVTAGCAKYLKDLKYLTELSVTLTQKESVAMINQLPHTKVVFSPASKIPVEVFEPLK